MMRTRAPRHRAPRRTPSHRTLALGTAAGILLGSLAATAPAHAAPSDIVSVASATRASDAQGLLDQINAHRASKGLAPVKYSATLSGIAQGQSDRLVNQEVINHTNTFLTDPRASGYNAAGEIHAISWRVSVTDLVNWWKNSGAHNKVLTDPRMQVIGIGLTYVDGSLAGDGSGWRLVGTVNSYGFPAGRAPADTSVRVGGGAPAPAPPQNVFPTSGYTIKGGIKTRYDSLGGHAVVGSPTMNERGGLINGGVYQSFRTAAGVRHKILWSPATGAHPVLESGAIGNAWQRAGYERGWGYPVTGEYRVGSEVQQRFSNGYVAHWSSVTGATWVTR